MKAVTSKTKKARLNKLIKYLQFIDENEPERFCLLTWMRGQDMASMIKATEEWKKNYKNKDPLNCNTTACVAGHLPVIFPGSWRWRMIDKPSTYQLLSEAHVTVTDKIYAKHYLHKTIERSPDNVGEFMADFFGGGKKQWDLIILPESYGDEGPDLDDVISRIITLKEGLYDK